MPRCGPLWACVAGGRRFWPAVCGRIDIDRLVGARDQVVGRSKSQIRIGLPSGGSIRRILVQPASDQQEPRYEGDPWEEVIGPWLEHSDFGSPRKLPQEAAGATDPDRQDSCRALPAGARLVAVSGASRGAARMALSKHRLKVTMFPVFPVWLNEFFCVPSVLDFWPGPLWTQWSRCSHIFKLTRNAGNIRNRIERHSTSYTRFACGTTWNTWELNEAEYGPAEAVVAVYGVTPRMSH